MAVSKSTNSGSSWERDTLTTVYAMCYALCFDPANSNIIYAGGNAGVYKSTNAGSTWFVSTTGLSGTVYDITVDPDNSATLYAGTSSGVYKSTNSGTNWSSTGCTNVKAVVVDNTTNTVYAGTGGGVYYSTNGGGSWTVMNTGLLNTNVTSLGLNHGIYLFAGTDGAGMWRWSLAVGAEENTQHDIARALVCHPNPTNGAMTIQYTMSRPLHADLSIYDVQGRKIVTLVNEQRSTGSRSVTWYGEDEHGAPVPAGIYFCKLVTDDATTIQKIIRLK
ncbi:T9SS type A sorting domain-containing protein [candidate division WOR-3 bacterium]|nr:T9SS type A sorting domain-containing protein [candidate division WOR-3 bacterium]